MVDVYRTLLLPLLSILCFLGVKVSEVLFGVEQGWETNCEINYQLINSRGITIAFLRDYPISNKQKGGCSRKKGFGGAFDRIRGAHLFYVS